jgi:hypothetical protein
MKTQRESLEQKSTREGGQNELRGSMDAMKALGRKPMRTKTRATRKPTRG